MQPAYFMRMLELVAMPQLFVELSKGYLMLVSIDVLVSERAFHVLKTATGRQAYLTVYLLEVCKSRVLYYHPSLTSFQVIQFRCLPN